MGERGTAILGYVSAALGYATLASAFAGWMLVPAIALLALGGLAVPSVRAMMSGTEGPDHQGETQGISSAVEGLTTVVAPLTAAGLFNASTSGVVPVRFAGAPFALATVCAIVACALPRKWRNAEAT